MQPERKDGVICAIEIVCREITCPSLESVPDEHEYFVFVIFEAVFDATNVFTENGHEHTHTNKDNEEDEQTETERTEKSCRATQLHGVERHQSHLEEHLDCAEESGASAKFGDEQQIEETNERNEDPCVLLR